MEYRIWEEKIIGRLKITSNHSPINLLCRNDVSNPGNTNMIQNTNPFLNRGRGGSCAAMLFSHYCWSNRDLHLPKLGKLRIPNISKIRHNKKQLECMCVLKNVDLSLNSPRQ